MVNKEYNILVSVVVPIYNVADYLEECIDSIKEQSYKNLEIILVNDGSTDGSQFICKKYDGLDKRIKCINKSNGGLSDARNVGLRAALGEYICFVDSDDYVSSEYIHDMLNEALLNEADIVCCGFQKKEGDLVVDERCTKKTQILSNRQALVDLFSPRGTIYPMAWNKLYRRILFSDFHIEYPVGKINEDEFTTYQLLYNANKTVVLNRVLYYYRTRPFSIMEQKFTQKRLELIEGLYDIENFVEKKCVDIADHARRNTVYKLYYLIRDCVLFSGDKDSYLYIKKNLKDKFIRARRITGKRKMQISLAIILPYGMYKGYIQLENFFYRIFCAIRHRFYNMKTKQ